MDDVARRVPDAEEAHLEHREFLEAAEQKVRRLVHDHARERHDRDEPAGDDDHLGPPGFARKRRSYSSLSMITRVRSRQRIRSAYSCADACSSCERAAIFSASAST